MTTWRLPGPRRFLEQVCASLSKQRHVVARVPRTVEREALLTHLQHVADAADLGTLTHLRVDASAEPVAALAQGLYAERRCFDVVDLFEVPAPSRLIAVEGIPEADASSAAWQRLLIECGDHTQVVDTPPFLFVVVTSPMFDPPPENVRLARHDWWGVTSRIEAELAMEQAKLDFPPPRLADHYWLRALCRGVAGGDPDLARLLVEQRPTTLDAVAACLSEHRRFDGATVPDQALRNGYRLPSGVIERPPLDGALRALWHAGALDWLPDEGVHVHPAVLIGLDHRDLLARRLWHGQVEVLLPLVETVRLGLVTHLNARLGRRWMSKLASTSSQEEREALESEIGALAYHLNRARKLPGVRPLVDVAERWRRIRNQLAHRDVVEHPTLVSAVEAYTRLG